MKICTAPWGEEGSAKAAACKEEKREWLQRHLGDEWTTDRKFICTKNKTAVAGSLLIDDKPDPASRYRDGNGSVPTWRHVVFSQPHNIADPACKGKLRLEAWHEWKQVLDML